MEPMDFKALDITTTVSDTLMEVFGTLLSMDLKPDEAAHVSALPEASIVGSIDFAGSVSGCLRIHVTRSQALKMAAAMLGTEPENIRDQGEIENVLGEICTRVGDSLASRLSEAGMPVRLGTPVSVRGAESVADSSAMAHWDKVVFRHGDEIVLMEVGARFGQDRNSQTGGPEAIAGAPEPVVPCSGTSALEESMAFLLDVPVVITVELGRTRKKIDHILQTGKGSVIELAKLAQEPVDLRVNGTLIARGEVVVDNEKYGVRILETVSRLKRIQSLA